MDNIFFLEQAVLHCKTIDELSQLVNTTFFYGSKEFALWSVIVEQLRNPGGEASESEIKLMEELKRSGCSEFDTLNIRRAFLQVDPSKPLTDPVNSKLLELAGLLNSSHENMMSGKSGKGTEKEGDNNNHDTSSSDKSDENDQVNETGSNNNVKSMKNVKNLVVKLNLNINEKIEEIIASDKPINSLINRSLTVDELYLALDMVLDILEKDPERMINPYLLQKILESCYNISGIKSINKLIELYCDSNCLKPNVRTVCAQLPNMYILRVLPLEDIEYFGQKYPKLFNSYIFLGEYAKRLQPLLPNDISTLDLDVCEDFYNTILAKLNEYESKPIEEALELCQCGLLFIGLSKPKKHYDIQLFTKFIEKLKTSILSRVNPTTKDTWKQVNLAPLIKTFNNDPHSTDFCEVPVVRHWDFAGTGVLDGVPLLSPSFYFFENLETNIIKPYIDEIIFRVLLEGKNELPSDENLRKFLFDSEWNKYFTFEFLVESVLRVISNKTPVSTLELFEKYNDLKNIDKVGIVTKGNYTYGGNNNNKPFISINKNCIRNGLKKNSRLNFVVESRFIRKISVAVYEISPFDYFKNHGNTYEKLVKQDFEAQHPTFLKDFEIPENYQDWRLVKTLISISPSTERAIMMVVVSGGGLSTKVVAQVGYVRTVWKATPNGYLFVVLDEDGHGLNDCAIHLSGVRYVQSRELLSGDSVAPIVIPYRNPKEVLNEDNNLIIEVPNSRFNEENPINEDTLQGDCDLLFSIERQGSKRVPLIPFASYEHFGYRTEEYEFKTSSYIDDNSVTNGSTGAIRCRAKLTINGETIVPFSIIKDARVDIVSVDNKGTTDITTYSNLEEIIPFLEGNCGLSFRVMEDTKRITVNFEIQLTTTVTKTKKILNSSEEFPFKQLEYERTSDIPLECLISYIHSPDPSSYSGYVLAILDPSGTPQEKFPLNLTAYPRFSGDKIESYLETDENGMVYLGDMKEISDIMVSWKSGEINDEVRYAASNVIPNKREMCRFSLDKQLTGENFKLPTFYRDDLRFNIMDNDNITIVGRKFYTPYIHKPNVNFSVCKCGSRGVVVSRLEESEYKVESNLWEPLCLSFPNEGFYKIYIHEGNCAVRVIDVDVRKEIVLDNKKSNLRYCKRDNTLSELTQQKGLSLIPKGTYYDQNINAYIVSMSCDTENGLEGITAFGNCSLFAPLQDFVGSFVTSDSEISKTLSMNINKPIVGCLEKLGEEGEYMKKRRIAERDGTLRIGCSLHRPGVVLNRRSEASVKSEHKVAAKGGKIIGYSSDINKSEVSRREKVMCGKAKRCKKAAVEDCCCRMKGIRAKEYLPIVNKSIILGNLDLRKTGSNTFDIIIPVTDIIENSSVDVIIRSGSDLAIGLSFTTNMDLEQGNPLSKNFRDLRLTECRDRNKNYVEKIYTSSSNPNSDTCIRNAGECEIGLYSSFPDYVKLIRAVFRNPDVSTVLNRLGKLEQWSQMSLNEKREFLKTNLCHETELFLYFKDPSFFASTIHPLLSSRFQPDFIDIYLLYVAPRHLRSIHPFSDKLPDFSLLSKDLINKVFEIARNMEELTKITPIEAIFILDFVNIVGGELNIEESKDIFKDCKNIIENYILSSANRDTYSLSNKERIQRIALNVASVNETKGEEELQVLGACDGISQDVEEISDVEDEGGACEKSLQDLVTYSGSRAGVNMSQMFSPEQASLPPRQMALCMSAAMPNMALRSSMPVLPNGARANSMRRHMGPGGSAGNFTQQLLKFGNLICNDDGSSGEYKVSAPPNEPSPQRFQALSVTTVFSEMTWMDVGSCGIGDSNIFSSKALSNGAHLFATNGWNMFWLDFCNYYIPEDNKVVQINEQPFTTKHFLEPLMSGSYTEAFVAYSILSSSLISVPQTKVIQSVANGCNIDWHIISPDKEKFTASHIISKQIVSLDIEEETGSKEKEDILVIVKQRIKPSNGNAAASLQDLYVNTHYMTEYTIINLSDKSIGDDTFQIITQIPQGAVPLKEWNSGSISHSGSYSKTTNITISPLNSINISMHYFFPIPGKYQLPNVIVSFNGNPVGSSDTTNKMFNSLRNNTSGNSSVESYEMVTVKKFSSGVSSSIMSNGVVFANMSNEDVIKWINTADFRKQFPDLYDYAHLGNNDPITRSLHSRLIKSKEFYKSVSSILERRGWSSLSLKLVGMHHNDWSAIKSLTEYYIKCMSRKGRKINPVLFGIESYLSNYSPFNDLSHFVSSRVGGDFSLSLGGDRLSACDFDPLVNERFFKLGDAQETANIDNKSLKEKYTNLLIALSVTPLENRPKEYKIWIAYYMILQNRIGEAAWLLADKKEEALHYANILNKGEQTELPTSFPYLQLCCLLSFIELSIISNNIDTKDPNNFPISFALSKIPPSSFVFTTIFGRYIYELAEYMKRLSGAVVQSDGSEKQLSEDEEKPTSYGKTSSITISTNDECSSICVSVPSEEGNKISVMFYNIDWEALLVNNMNSGLSTLISKTSSGKEGVIIEQIEADDTISYLIPRDIVEYDLDEESNPEISREVDIVVPEELRSIPFIVGVRVTIDKTIYFKLMPQIISIIPEEKTGVLRVVDRHGNSVIGCYIRVMATKYSSETGFWKDGYTDLVGRFDYATVSAQEIRNVNKFIIYAERGGVGCTLKKVNKPDV